MLALGQATLCRKEIPPPGRQAWAELLGGDDVTADMFLQHAYQPKSKPVTTLFLWCIPTLHLSPPPILPRLTPGKHQKPV